MDSMNHKKPWSLKRQILQTVLVGLLVFMAFIGVNQRVSDNAARTAEADSRARDNAALVEQLTAIQANTSHTLTALLGAIKSSGPAQKAAIDNLVRLIQQEDDALLAAIRGQTRIIVHPLPQPTKTVYVCRTPSGKSC